MPFFLRISPFWNGIVYPTQVHHCVLEADILFSECHLKEAEIGMTHLEEKEDQGLGDINKRQEKGME